MKILTQKMLGAQGLATEELWFEEASALNSNYETHNLAGTFIGDHPLHIVYLLGGEHFGGRIESVAARPSLWLPQLQRTVCVFALLGLDEDT
jgi:hypothetical protein